MSDRSPVLLRGAMPAAMAPGRANGLYVVVVGEEPLVACIVYERLQHMHGPRAGRQSTLGLISHRGVMDTAALISHKHRLAYYHIRTGAQTSTPLASSRDTHLRSMFYEV